ncbi:hypothetical protein CH063_01351 [Colletotrichum higginsianum]|uniref:AAA family ATPase n=2 Tax=Colletotrichum higginsianum TaxID=80884 RepID=H1V609_COLHI|nr:AAA family ATPase [Colletotrichum higginsianum IMI 349063]OBR04176.1 AAA family ATPase [Colletotrichum higginsianum IMI 349063]CCF35661.1 hypothetical protein CH063_01351 [Colletotrichum higginsianum]
MPPEVQLVPARQFPLEQREVVSPTKEMTDSSHNNANASHDDETSANFDAEALKTEEDAVVPDHGSPSGRGDLIPFKDTKEEFEVLQEATIRSQYLNTMGRSVFANEKEAGRLRTRGQQAILHHTFTEMRIEDLEKELKELRTYVYKLEDDLEPVKKKMLPVHRHELQCLSANQFRVTGQSSKLHWTQQPALEVQLPEGVAPITTSSETPVEPHAQAHEGEHPVSNRMQSDEPRTPESLRIRSYSLMSHLQDITGKEVLARAERSMIAGEMVHGGIVFLRPFKFFVRNEELIRESLKKLEDKMEKTQAAKNAPKPVDSKSEKTGQQEYEDTDLMEDLKLLIDRFFDVELTPTFELRRKIDEGTAVDIEYGDLWHLFSRGDIVVFQSDQTHARRVVNLAGGREPLSYRFDSEDEKVSRVDGFVVDCLSLHANGSTYVPKLEKVSIKRFNGKRPITSLLVYPLRFDPRKADLRTNFTAMGRRLLSLTSTPCCHKLVQGKTLDEPSHELDTQVIVDMTLAMSVNPEWRLKSAISTDDFTQRDKRETIQDPWCYHRREGCCGSDAIFKDLEYDEMDSQIFAGEMVGTLGPVQAKDLQEEDLMLMQPYVYAFVLRSRQWVKVWTADLRDVVFENNFEDLVVPDEHKETVRALVKTHENTRASHLSSDIRPSMGSGLDLVKGKGAGLVILLHGPPGVGKTSTAECVADDTKRPLYPITCGDIGETAAEVESNLQYNFRLATKWGCVLLLDEADVFLAKRTRSDLRHNAVTSVFLRSLEYYAGILFLTSNRVGAIDPAFKSRIQMSLSYPKLDLGVTCKLYEKFIERTKAEQKKTKTYNFKIRDKEILAFAKKHYLGLEKENRETWNGRQIRNAFQTAIALVEYQDMSKDADEPKPSLGKKQFKSVAQGSREFDDYLYSVLGSTEADGARQDGWRDDGFMASSAPLGYVPLTAVQRPQAAWPPQMKQSGKKEAQISDSDDASDSETDDEDVKEGDKGKKAKGTGSSAAAIETSAVSAAGGGSDMEQFQKFLKFQEMMAKQSA